MIESRITINPVLELTCNCNVCSVNQTLSQAYDSREILAFAEAKQTKVGIQKEIILLYFYVSIHQLFLDEHVFTILG